MNCSLRSPKTEEEISVSDLRSWCTGWLAEARYRSLSPATIETRSLTVDLLLTWCAARQYDALSKARLREFFAHLQSAHEEPGGRWQHRSARAPLPQFRARAQKALRPRTIESYYGTIRAFYNWMKREGAMTDNPFDTLRAPIARKDQVQPFTKVQIEALLAATQKSRYPARNRAVLLLLLDTGMRAAELCGLQRERVSLIEGFADVIGKGNKQRRVHFSPATRRALLTYQRQQPPTEGAEPLIATEEGEHFRPESLGVLIRRLCARAQIDDGKCGPHRLRHTFAVEFLRAGGNQFTLMELMGHTDLSMTRRYVAFAQADIERQHQRHSPVQSMLGASSAKATRS
jgi:site-specific recombinase XerD